MDKKHSTDDINDDKVVTVPFNNKLEKLSSVELSKNIE